MRFSAPQEGRELARLCVCVWSVNSLESCSHFFISNMLSADYNVVTCNLMPRLSGLLSEQSV